MKTYLLYVAETGLIESQTTTPQDDVTPAPIPGKVWLQIAEPLVGRFWNNWHIVSGQLTAGPPP